MGRDVMISSAHKLILELVFSAFQRCRLSEDLCRLSVVLNRSNRSDYPAFSVSVSDTGMGSCVDEFRGFKYPEEDVSAESWDGVFFIKTTGISDNEINNYCFNLKESTPFKRLTRLPPISKNGAKFSGTEASLSISGSVNALLADLNDVFQKMLVLKIPNIVIELAAENGDDLESQYDHVFLANELNPLPFTASHVERLKSGLECYVMKHGNVKVKKCDLCFPTWEHLKIGSGTECGSDKGRNCGLLMDTVIIVSQSSEPISNCFRACGAETKVLYFRDFLPCSIPQSCLNMLGSFDWKSYGLLLGSTEDRHGHGMLKWENLPENAHIDIALHCYCENSMIPPTRQKGRISRHLLKNSLRRALDDLKNKHTGWLLSTRALETLSYAPDLAKTLAGLILSSNDSGFKDECLSLLGLNSTDVDSENVVECVKEKITSVIEIEDRKPQKSKEAAPFLFQDDCIMDLEFQEEAFEEGEDSMSLLD